MLEEIENDSQFETLEATYLLVGRTGFEPVTS